MKAPLTKSDALFSDCELYRYRLWRQWDRTLPVALFCMMNPSTADEIENDPTVERQVRRVRQWETMGGIQLEDGRSITRWGGVEVVNAFAWRETYSGELRQRVAEGVDIVGPDNDAAILDAAATAAIVVCGWGVMGKLLDRGVKLLALLRGHAVTPYALRVNKDGSPRHPLYVSYGRLPTPL